MTEGQGLARRLVMASRPLSWINTAFPFAAAMLLTTQQVDIPLVIGTLFFLVPYNLALYGINDVYDYASDLANPRKGGAEGALLPPETHRAVLGTAVALALPFVIALVLLGGPASWVALAASLFALVAYSVPPLRTKEIPLLDSVTSSAHFVSPAVYGLVLAGADWSLSLLALLLAFFLWGMASHAFGAVQDIVPDTQAGIHSIATRFGARATVRMALVLWAAAGAVMLLQPWPTALATLLAVPYMMLSLPYVSVSDADSASTNRGWKKFLWVNYVGGFMVTMLCLVWLLR